MKILSLDLAAATGWCFLNRESGERHSGEFKIRAKPATKNRTAEPTYYRLDHLREKLLTLMVDHQPDLVAIEEAEGFKRGQAAVEASHQYRGVALLMCAMRNLRAVTVNPNDLLFFALGKKTCKRDEKKREMILHAQQKYGYEGKSDDEAEAIIIAYWADTYYGAGPKVPQDAPSNDYL